MPPAAKGRARSLALRSPERRPVGEAPSGRGSAGPGGKRARRGMPFREDRPNGSWAGVPGVGGVREWSRRRLAAQHVPERHKIRTQTPVVMAHWADRRARGAGPPDAGESCCGRDK
jgi:hypothetical protein